MKTVAIIMAGGKGERFWPISKKDFPKQFISLTKSKLTMIQLSVERIKKIVKNDDIYIVTNEIYKNIVYEQLPYISKGNILLEPLSKNTAPCIAFATAVIKQKYKDANVLVLAADHYIKNVNLFLDSIDIGIQNITKNNIITLGIVPTRIETGYGYIELGKSKKNNIYFVNKFIEKPDYVTAKEYYDSGNYLWNSGMFLWRNSFMEKCIEKYTPELYKMLNIIYNNINNSNFTSILKSQYDQIEAVSIDYAIMEKVDNIMVIPGNFGWDDVGSWLSVERLQTSDINNNIIVGNNIVLNSNNNILINHEENKLIATLGIENTIIVQHQDCLLIMNKDNCSDIKQLIDEIKNKYDKYL